MPSSASPNESRLDSSKERKWRRRRRQPRRILRWPRWPPSKALASPSQRRRGSRQTPSARALDPRSANPFPIYDREVARLRTHLRALGPSGWLARSHCRGWSVKDIVAHLSTDEVYNQACLDGTLNDLPFSGGLGGWNGRGVRIRRAMSPLEVLQEWEARQALGGWAWGKIGVGGGVG